MFSVVALVLAVLGLCRSARTFSVVVHGSFSSCGAEAAEHAGPVVAAPELLKLWGSGLVVPGHVGC